VLVGSVVVVRGVVGFGVLLVVVRVVVVVGVVVLVVVGGSVMGARVRSPSDASPR
jgi:hypothetical protein